MEQTSRQAAELAGGKVIASPGPLPVETCDGAILGAQERLERSVTRLQRLDPSLSAKSGVWPAQRTTLACLSASAAAMILAAPATMWIGLQCLFATAFATLLCVRLLALHHALTGPHRPSGASNMALATARSKAARDACDGELPVYTILIALHDEVPVVPQLVCAMQALDYPTAKLDVIFALEAHDTATRNALLAADLAPHMRLVIVPEGLPRTKPRALCYALTLARGEFVVVYDAEDVPDPDQLRKALTAFAAGGEKLGCLQASLAIDNARKSWLTAQFAIEYTTLFDAILPAYSANNLPIPLGGTSNHFRSAALHSTGGWDPFNVTEDADLGLRLARFGWQVSVLNSTTWEEAPAEFEPWLAQRTRWQKGWLQSYFVHMRHPRRLWRELGPASWLWFQIVLGGGLISTLAHPWFYVMLALDWANGRLFPPLGNGLSAWVWWIGVANLTAAALATIALAWISLKRRGRRDLFVPALMAPLYWLPISLAGYRAVYEWVKAPFYWAKTPHSPRPGQTG